MRQVDERDRLLYVALTRAESWLIVMGSGDIKEEADCWYNAIRSAAIAKGAAPLITAAGSGLRYEPRPWRAGALRPMEKLEREKCQVPVWAKTTTSPVPQKISPRAPSDLGGDKVVSNTLADANPDALSLGEAVHTLLEVLPSIPKEKWKTVAEKLIKNEVFLQAWAEAQDILMHPDLSLIHI